MRSVRKIAIVAFLAAALTLSTFVVDGRAFTHDESFGQNYEPGYKGGGADSGNRIYYDGYAPGYYYGYGPQAYYHDPPVSVVVPFPVFVPGYYYHHHHHHH